MSNLADKNWFNRLDNSRLLRYILLFTLGWAITQVLAFFQAVIFIFLLSAILAFLLSYPVHWLRRFLPHGLAVTCVFIAALGISGVLITTVGIAFISQAQQFLNTVPSQIDYISDRIENLDQFLSQWNISLKLNTLVEQLRTKAFAGVGLALTSAQFVLARLLDIIFITILTLFMLLDGRRVWNFCLKLFPREWRGKLTGIVKQNLSGFFWGQLLLTLFLGITGFIIYAVLQIPYALLIAMLIAFLYQIQKERRQ